MRIKSELLCSWVADFITIAIGSHLFCSHLSNLSLSIGFSTTMCRILCVLLLCFVLCFQGSSFYGLLLKFSSSRQLGLAWLDMNLEFLFHSSFSYLLKYCTFHYNKFNLIVDYGVVSLLNGTHSSIQKQIWSMSCRAFSKLDHWLNECKKKKKSAEINFAWKAWKFI